MMGPKGIHEMCDGHDQLTTTHRPVYLLGTLLDRSQTLRTTLTNTLHTATLNPDHHLPLIDDPEPFAASETGRSRVWAGQTYSDQFGRK